MHDKAESKNRNRDRDRDRRRSWCCSLKLAPLSPENPQPQPQPQVKSFPNSPQRSTTTSTKPSLSLVGRILSPGRVSPIAIDDTIIPLSTLKLNNLHPTLPTPAPPSPSPSPSDGILDVRLNLKGKNGVSLVLQLSSQVLIANSSLFADLIRDYRNTSSSPPPNLCRIEVPQVDHLNAFRDTIELMFEPNITHRLFNCGVYRSILILEVSAGIMFTKGVLSCLKYLEAVPWSEEEEEKLRSVFTKFQFDDAISSDILARLYSFDSADSQQSLVRQLVWSIATCVDEANARNELKSLVKGLLCRSSVYKKDYPDLNKEDIYNVCQSCMDSLVSLFEEATGTDTCGESHTTDTVRKPLIERISKQVDNINWLVEILLDRQMGEEFVEMWADQGELLRMHEGASPMVRYEVSRVSAMLFIAMGTRKLHCRSEARLGLLQSWFRPMLLDFGWLRRCRKGLDMKALEEAMGQTLLTLPLKQQYMLFMEWFRCFSKHGTECPNLNKAFQIWWRRSFLRGSESYFIESR